MSTPDTGRFDLIHEQWLQEWTEDNLRHLSEVCADYVPWTDAKSSSEGDRAMSEQWVVYDAISGDVAADGTEGQTRRYVSAVDDSSEGKHTLVAASEAEWKRVVKRGTGMSGNPPRRNPASIEHL